MKTNRIKASIKPDDQPLEFVIRDDNDMAIAYISVTGDILLVSTFDWSDCTVDDITDRKPIQVSEVRRPSRWPNGDRRKNKWES